VTDSGQGIAAGNLEAIFSEFYQVASVAKGGAEGTGLGLPIARRLIEEQGGTIWVESDPGRGSTFHFLLPARHKPALPVPEEAPHLPVPRDRPLALLIDAAPDSRELLASALNAAGYRAVAADPAAPIVEQLARLQPDVVILDPQSSSQIQSWGWEILNLLKQSPATARIPVVITSALTEKRRGFALGAKEYLLKPVVKESLLRAVRRLVPPWSKTNTVIIVDHQADNQRFLSEVVLAAGYQPLAARNGKKALEMIDHVHPGAVLVNLQLPEMDAFQVIVRLRADPRFRALPILALCREAPLPGQAELLSGHTRLLLLQEHDSRERITQELHQLFATYTAA
jgi:CheY-like chemotaxis protein